LLKLRFSKSRHFPAVYPKTTRPNTKLLQLENMSSRDWRQHTRTRSDYDPVGISRIQPSWVLKFFTKVTLIARNVADFAKDSQKKPTQLICTLMPYPVSSSIYRICCIYRPCLSYPSSAMSGVQVLLASISNTSTQSISLGEAIYASWVKQKTPFVSCPIGVRSRRRYLTIVRTVD
jgi:hypothetical protein